jgi:hypothetical protein
MNESWSSILSILDNLGINARNVSVMTIGLPETELPDFAGVDAYETVSGPSDLPRPLRAQLGIVVTPLDYMPRTSAEQLLSRLRDVHCEKVLLVDTRPGWSPDVLRSLGYLEVKRPSNAGRCYLFDPDMFNQPREWNTSTDWANPENFRKYRW